MKRLILKSILFAAPFVVLFVLDAVVLPIDFFTFRVWEALRITTPVTDPVMPGPFLPSFHVVKDNEQGSFRRSDDPRKRVEWFTDSFGYRNRPEVAALSRFDVVTIGDSNIAGSYFDQKDTLAEALSRQCHCTVYNHGASGPTDLVRYLRRRKFADNPPKLVVYEFRLCCDVLDSDNFIPSPAAVPADIDEPKPADCATMAWKTFEIRRKRWALMQWVRSRLGTALSALPTPPPQEATDINAFARARTKVFVEKMRWYADTIQARGSRFVLLAMPAAYVEGDKILSDEVVPALHDAGLDVLTFPPRQNSGSYYSPFDGHWLESSAVTAAGMITDDMKASHLLGRTDADGKSGPETTGGAESPSPPSRD